MSNKEARVGVAVFVFNDKKEFLLGKRKGAHGEGTYSLPGGQLEFGETFNNAVKRELAEETDIRTYTRLSELGFSEEMYPRLSKHYITLFFKCHTNTSPFLMEPDKCEGWNWYSLDNLPSPLFGGITKMIETHFKPDKSPKIDEVQEFFENLGYTVSRDQRNGGSEQWWEILNNKGKLICQIDTNVPLEDIIEDLTCIANNLPTTSKSEYTINHGPSSSEIYEFLDLCKKCKGR